MFYEVGHQYCKFVTVELPKNDSGRMTSYGIIGVTRGLINSHKIVLVIFRNTFTGQTT